MQVLASAFAVEEAELAVVCFFVDVVLDSVVMGLMEVGCDLAVWKVVFTLDIGLAEVFVLVVVALNVGFARPVLDVLDGGEVEAWLESWVAVSLVTVGFVVVGLFMLDEVVFAEDEADVTTCTFGLVVDVWLVLFAALELEDLVEVLELSEAK